MRSHQPGLRKQALQLIRGGIGGDIKILGLAAEQYIADATTHQIGLPARCVQSVNNRAGQ